MLQKMFHLISFLCDYKMMMRLNNLTTGSFSVPARTKGSHHKIEMKQFWTQIIENLIEHVDLNVLFCLVFFRSKKSNYSACSCCALRGKNSTEALVGNPQLDVSPSMGHMYFLSHNQECIWLPFRNKPLEDRTCQWRSTAAAFDWVWRPTTVNPACTHKTLPHDVLQLVRVLYRALVSQKLFTRSICIWGWNTEVHTWEMNNSNFKNLLQLSL